jgi:hypothetical protein
VTASVSLAQYQNQKEEPTHPSAFDSVPNGVTEVKDQVPESSAHTEVIGGPDSQIVSTKNCCQRRVLRFSPVHDFY